MNTDQAERERQLREFLDQLPLVTLRVLGRKAGVAQPAGCNKDQLVDTIILLATGKMTPAVRSGRGAPPKTIFLDPEVVARFDRLVGALKAETNELSVASPEPVHDVLYSDSVYRGILEITQGGYGFLRAKNCQPSSTGADVFIAAPAIHSLRLREGDLVTCTARPRQKNDSAAMDELLTVNGLPVGRYEQRPQFDSLTAKYPCEKIALSEGCGELSLRVLDLFVPIGKGQRALIIAPPKAGKTTLLKNIAKAVAAHHDDIHLIVLLIDERPEEVTDFRSSVEGAEVIYSTFDEGADHHVRAAELTIAHAKRLAEQGKDVVILLDSLTKLTRAYNYIAESTGKTLTGGLDAGALSEPKRFFGAARNTVEGGSITILSTVLVDTGSRMDDVIYEEFKGTGNADIFLSRDLAERRIFPAIDIRRSGTRKEELLLTKDELSAVYKMRERGLVENAVGLFDMMKRTEDNSEFVTRLPDWMKVFKNNV